MKIREFELSKPFSLRMFQKVDLCLQNSKKENFMYYINKAILNFFFNFNYFTVSLFAIMLNLSNLISLPSNDLFLKIGLGLGAIVQIVFIISLILFPQTEDDDGQLKIEEPHNNELTSTKTDFYNNLIQTFKKNKKNKDKKKRK